MKHFMLSRKGADVMEKKTIKKKCSDCNSLFECHANNIESCFCNTLYIRKSDLQYISNQYTDCLCPVCLERYNQKNAQHHHRLVLLFILFLVSTFIFPQFPGPVGSANTTALYKDSSAFVAWASNCVVQRGPQDIATPSLGLASAGVDSDGTLKAGDNGVVSLGDGGYAILTFPSPITNGTGFDFAVFENAFNDLFLELGFVEVSSDGINFFRFPATSSTQFTTQIGTFDQLGDATKLNNLGGKYRIYYGTPFDLEEMKNISGLDINTITHVKVIDVIGDINAPYATHDQFGSPVNDPYPTPFPSGGFDLDAVGVIHQKSLGLHQNELNLEILIYPNPCKENIIVSNVCFESGLYHLLDFKGELLKTEPVNVGKTIIDTRDLENGIYFLKIKQNSSCIYKKIVVQK